MWINIENGERGKSLVITPQWSNTFGPDCSLQCWHSAHWEVCISSSCSFNKTESMVYNICERIDWNFTNKKVIFLEILQLLPTESEKYTANCTGYHVGTECFHGTQHPVTSRRSTQSLWAFLIQCIEISGMNCGSSKVSYKIELTVTP